MILLTGGAYQLKYVWSCTVFDVVSSKNLRFVQFITYFHDVFHSIQNRNFCKTVHQIIQIQTFLFVSMLSANSFREFIPCDRHPSAKMNRTGCNIYFLSNASQFYSLHETTERTKIISRELWRGSFRSSRSYRTSDVFFAPKTPPESVPAKTVELPARNPD